MSNLVSQLEIQNAGDRLPEVMKEIPKVRAEVGYLVSRGWGIFPCGVISLIISSSLFCLQP